MKIKELEDTFEAGEEILKYLHLTTARRPVQKHKRAVEVTSISGFGIWLLMHGQAHFLPFEQFPWFQDASVKNILHVEMPSDHHLYWPDLDVDLELESILHPESYPLISKVNC